MSPVLAASATTGAGCAAAGDAAGLLSGAAGVRQLASAYAAPASSTSAGTINHRRRRSGNGSVSAMAFPIATARLGEGADCRQRETRHVVGDALQIPARRHFGVEPSDDRGTVAVEDALRDHADRAETDRVVRRRGTD